MNNPDDLQEFARGVFSGRAPRESLSTVHRALRDTPFSRPGVAESAARHLARTPRIPVCLLIEVGNAKPKQVEATLLSWALQGASVAPMIVAATKSTADELQALTKQYKIAAPVLRSTALPSADGFLVFARPGELFHPQLSRTLEGLPLSVEAVTWSVFVQEGASDAPAMLDNRQNRGPVALVGSLGCVGLAVRASAAASWSARPGLSLARQAQIFAAGLHARSWAHLVEGFSAVRFAEGFEAAARSWSAYDENLPASVAASAPDIEVLGENGAARFLPRRRGSGIAAIISVDDIEQGSVTLHSLAGQKTGGRLTATIVLPEKLRPAAGALSKTGQKLFPGSAFSLQFCSDDNPTASRFNQAAAQGNEEVLLFVRQGLSLPPAGAVEEMAAWALAHEVGAVCCRVLETGLSPVATLYSNDVSWTAQRFGAPLLPRLACTAVSRLVWRTTGEFDDWRFGRSLFDLEYALRLARLGLQNLRLGHLSATVAAIAESDEPAEAALLHALYPEIAGLKVGAASSLARALAETPLHRQALERTGGRDSAAFLLNELLAVRRSRSERNGSASEVSNSSR